VLDGLIFAGISTFLGLDSARTALWLKGWMMWDTKDPFPENTPAENHTHSI
jgi:hypothetical protein